MALQTDITRTYPLASNASAQSVAYALAEYLDLEKSMITQTMRIRNGYTIQCKGDAVAEWTKYLGMDVALTIQIIESTDTLVCTIGFDKWLEKLGIAAVGAFIFQPLMLTAAVGALRQATVPQDIFAFIENYLEVRPLEAEGTFNRTMPQTITCAHCGAINRSDATYCKKCGKDLMPKEISCPSCGYHLDGDEAFCPHCGNKLAE